MTGAALEPHRRHLAGLAYRMLGSVSEAQDIVQEAFLRWHEADRAGVDNPRAFLSTIVTRLCLDQIKSARARRETYVGAWLPEPVLDPDALTPEDAAELAQDLSVAFLLTLERLSPLERAAFLLHDVFDADFSDVARMLGRSEEACRQLAARARRNVRQDKRRYATPPEAAEKMFASFAAAVQSGDLAQLTGLLTEDAVLLTDGGGKVPAALNPILGADKIARFILGIARKARGFRLADARPAQINGLPGLLLRARDGELRTAAFELAGDRIAAIYLVANPDKLRHLVGAPALHPARSASVAPGPAIR